MTTKASAAIAGTTNASGATTRVAFDIDALTGPKCEQGTVVMSIRNGATGPTVGCTGRLLVARKQASMPAAAAEGGNENGWFKVMEFYGGTANNGITTMEYPIGADVAYIEVEFTGNTAQGVGVFAFLSYAG